MKCVIAFVRHERGICCGAQLKKVLGTGIFWGGECQCKIDLGSSLVVKFLAQCISQIHQWMEDIYCTKAAAEREK